jgi:hypothetical protein
MIEVRENQFWFSKIFGGLFGSSEMFKTVTQGPHWSLLEIRERERERVFF